MEKQQPQQDQIICVSEGVRRVYSLFTTSSCFLGTAVDKTLAFYWRMKHHPPLVIRGLEPMTWMSAVQRVTNRATRMPLLRASIMRWDTD